VIGSTLDDPVTVIDPDKPDSDVALDPLEEFESELPQAPANNAIKPTKVMNVSHLKRETCLFEYMMAT
jgi:hypothetical protein